MNNTYNIDNWYKINCKALDELYYELIRISELHEIQLIDNDKSYNDFIYMMYKESNKTVINRIEFPEYFNLEL
jgi:hypothetical protein